MALGRVALLIVASVLLMGCTTLSTLPDGAAATLAGDDLRLRSSLQIRPQNLPPRLAYRPGATCRYVQFVQRVGGQATVEDQTVSLRAARDRILVTLQGKAGASTALIGGTGHLYDFNLVNSQDAGRTTQENFSERAQDKLKQAQSRRGAHVLNDFALLTPEYRSGVRPPGAVAAVIPMEDGSIWGEFLYRGIATHNGAEVYVFDIVRTPETMPGAGPVTMGFSLVDPQNLLPVQLVLNTQSIARMTRTSCG